MLIIFGKFFFLLNMKILFNGFKIEFLLGINILLLCFISKMLLLYIFFKLSFVIGVGLKFFGIFILKILKLFLMLK